MLLKKLQRTKSTVSTSIAATTNRSGFSAAPSSNRNKGYTKYGPGGGGGGSGGGGMRQRAEWVDPTTNVRAPGFGHSLSGSGDGGGASANTRKLFRGGDLSDIALQACPDKHTLK
jgi:hypothetical protein